MTKAQWDRLHNPQFEIDDEDDVEGDTLLIDQNTPMVDWPDFGEPPWAPDSDEELEYTEF